MVTYVARFAHEILIDAKPTPINGAIFTEFSYSYRGEKWWAAGKAIGNFLPALNLKSCLDFVSKTFPP